MNDRENIARMARSCGINFHQAGWPELERFAALVIEDFLKRSGQYLTNDASREAALTAERASILQLFTDPENQPTQHGTVTLEYMQREITAERERFSLECIDLVAAYGGPVDLEAAIRARGQA